MYSDYTVSEFLSGFTDTKNNEHPLEIQTTSDKKSLDLQMFPHESLNGERECGGVEKDLPAVT